MEPNLNFVLDQVGKDKGIDKRILVEALEAAMLTAARKRFGLTTDMEARFNEQTGEVEIYEFKKIVHVVTNRAGEISFVEAKNLDPELTDESVGDDIGIKVDSADFGRIAAQTAKQVIIQRVREAERFNVYNEYKDRKSELVNGIARRFERGNIVVDLGRAEAVLPIREQVPRENYRAGDRIQAYVLDVMEVAKGPQIILSRTHPGLLIKLFEQEVPEIAEGIVKIEAAAREPGVRAKIAVSSRDYDVDPVGACVGMKGARVQTVVQELRGEKIDIVPFDEDPARFVCNALSPAEVSRVLIDEGNHAMEIVVPDDQLSLAIGRRGQNVRLAAQLTGWKIDITSETKVMEQREVAFRSLGRIEGLSDFVVQTLYNHGFRSAQDVVEAEDEFLASLPGFSPEAVTRVKTAARAVVETERTEKDAEKRRARDDARALMSVQVVWDKARGDLAGPQALEKDHARLAEVDGVSPVVQQRLQESGFDSPEDVYFEFSAPNLSSATGLPLAKAKQVCRTICEMFNHATGGRAPAWQDALTKAETDEARHFDSTAGSNVGGGEAQA
jgi:N utilization substance protein A